MNPVASNFFILKYQKSTTLSSIDVGIRKFEFVTKTQFLSMKKHRLFKIQDLVLSINSITSYILLAMSFLLTGLYAENN